MKKLLLITLMFVSVQLFAQKQFQNEASGNIAYASGHIKELAEAIPADKFSWAPQEGVRSVAGVLTHLISANYFFGSKIGGTIPEGVNMETLEKDLTEKDEIMKELKQSYEVLIGAVKGIEDDQLAEKVQTPFGEFSQMSIAFIGLSHANEHLGQLIAYARMNSITPPWSKPKEEKSE